MSLVNSVKGWVRYGFCPIEISARTETLGCTRYFLVATFCGRGDQELFLGEYDDRAAMDRARRAYLAVITRTWNKAIAGRAPRVCPPEWWH